MFAVLALSLIEMQILMSVKQTRQALICTIFVSFRSVARRIMRRKVCHKMQHRQQAPAAAAVAAKLRVKSMPAPCNATTYTSLSACVTPATPLCRQLADKLQTGSQAAWQNEGLSDCLTSCLAAWRLNACREQTQQNFKFIQINSLSSPVCGRGT